MISGVILQLLIYFLPTQLGLHLWPSFAYVGGLRLDYLSPTIYVTDILTVTYVLLNLKQLLSKIRDNHRPPLIIFIVTILNTLYSQSVPITVIAYLRLFEYISLFFCLRANKIKIKDISFSLSMSLLLTISLEFLQFFKQSSLNGIWYYLGERRYSLSTPNIARLNIFGHDLLRPYSFFSHPNSLAGFLLLSLVILRKSTSKLLYALIVLSIICTLSKTAIVGIILLFVSPTIIIPLSLAISLIPLFPILNTSRYLPISSRITLAQPVISLIKNNLLLGVGLGAYLPSLVKVLPSSSITPAYIQPVHSLPLLYMTETGLAGILSIACLIKKQLKEILKNKMLMTALAIVLFTGSVDHYWLTLHQNQLLLTIVLAVIV